jgi:hypothetical protein
MMAISCQEESKGKKVDKPVDNKPTT